MVMDPRMTVGCLCLENIWIVMRVSWRLGLCVRWSDGLVIFDGMAEDAGRYA